MKFKLILCKRWLQFHWSNLRQSLSPSSPSIKTHHLPLSYHSQSNKKEQTNSRRILLFLLLWKIFESLDTFSLFLCVKDKREREMGVLFQVLTFAILSCFLYIIWRILFSCWISPAGVYLKLKKNGFGGPTPNFPLGNHKEIKSISRAAAAAAAASSSSYITTFSSSGTSEISNDIHSSVFPYFSQWQKSHGKTRDLLLLNLLSWSSGLYVCTFATVSVKRKDSWFLF